MTTGHRAPPAMNTQTLWAPRAWLQGRWQERVVFDIDTAGNWQRIEADQPAPASAVRLGGPVLPALVNAHSHAFQRAFAGLAERRQAERDDFWSWRDRMYGVALRIGPDELRTVATRLYRELLQGGFTQVCEFHYLQHDTDGKPYADNATMCRALAEAAAATGIGLTLLPVVYERAGFRGEPLRADQRRFALNADQALALRDAVRSWQQPHVTAGVALHSLRAATAESMHRVADVTARDAAPIHIHIAEQTAEVDECVAVRGVRPIAWLAREFALDARWQLVHATHATPAEIEAVAASGAGVVLCPGTEANLGDGLPDLPRWLASGTPLSLGTDSHVTRSAIEELRWLEYGQRLVRRQRNVAAEPSAFDGSSAARLFERMLAGGAAAAGFHRWGFEPGARADLLVIDPRTPGLEDIPASHLLDALVFASGASPFAESWVAGRCLRLGGC
jgi:formimidoylglutamate deiminase